MATAAEKKAAAAEAKAKKEAAAAAAEAAAEAEKIDAPGTFGTAVIEEEPIEVVSADEMFPVEHEATTASVKEAGVVLIYRRTKTVPGTKKRLFNLDCVANEEGLFETTVSPERATIEVNRRVLARFEKK